MGLAWAAWCVSVTACAHGFRVFKASHDGRVYVADCPSVLSQVPSPALILAQVFACKGTSVRDRLHPCPCFEPMLQDDTDKVADTSFGHLT